MTNLYRRLYRSRVNRKIAGVCGGLGEYFNVDPTIMRLLYILVILFSVGLGILAYLVMWAVMPEAPDQPSMGTVDQEHPQHKK